MAQEWIDLTGWVPALDADDAIEAAWKWIRSEPAILDATVGEPKCVHGGSREIDVRGAYEVPILARMRPEGSTE